MKEIKELYKNKIQEIMGLEKVLLVAKEFYYTGKAEDLMSDYQYDMMEERMKRLCPDHPIMELVGYGDSYKLLTFEETTKLFHG